MEERLLGFRGYPGLLFGEPLWIRTLTALKVLERIARLLVFPIALSPDYSFGEFFYSAGLVSLRSEVTNDLKRRHKFPGNS